MAFATNEPPSREVASTLTIASGARTTSTPSGLRMSRPVVRSASQPSFSSIAEPATATRHPSPTRALTASAARSVRPSNPTGPMLNRR
jgi:hypothetical protein